MGRRWTGLFLRIVLVWCGCCVVGCATIRVTPPSSVSDPVTVFVADFGKHSSLLLPTGAGTYVEWTWGDWDALAAHRESIWIYIDAVIASDGGALGRAIHLDFQPLWFAQETGAVLSAIPVERAGVDALHHELTGRFRAASDTRVFNPFVRLEIVRDDSPGRYWLGHNCNHTTAQWLRRLGARVDGIVLSSGFRVRTNND